MLNEITSLEFLFACMHSYCTPVRSNNFLVGRFLSLFGRKMRLVVSSLIEIAAVHHLALYPQKSNRKLGLFCDGHFCSFFSSVSFSLFYFFLIELQVDIHVEWSQCKSNTDTVCH